VPYARPWRLGMKCPRCAHDNPQGARFCEECGTPTRIATTLGLPVADLLK